jgi:hypothetical protein
MEEEQKQQQQQPLHRAVVKGLAWVKDPRFRHVRHTLRIDGYGGPPIERQSLQHLIDFLDNVESHEVAITELYFSDIELVSDPSPDGGLDVLKDFFGRSDTTVTKVALYWCKFGSTQDASQLLAAFHTNRIITDLAISHGVPNLEGAALGNSISGLM